MSNPRKYKLPFSFLLMFTLLLSLWSSIASAANLTASVDKNVLGLNETFVLTLRYDEQINSAPDYTLLEKDFDILNTQSGNYMSLVNGRSESYTQWTIALAPKKIGTALIPSFNINDAISDAIQITVEGKNKSAQDTVLVDITVDKSQAFVQEQLLIKLRLITYVDLAGANVEPLQIKDALVVQVDDKKYRSVSNGREAITYETTFAVFPQQSGELVIPSVLYQVEVANNMRDYRDFFSSNRGSLMRLRTDEQLIPIKPTPNDTRAQPWLPAKDIRIEEHWSSSPDAAKVGEPLTRTLTVRAEGLSAAQLPPLPAITIDGLNAYQDQAQNDDQKNEQGVIGSRIETTAIVANQPGKFTLPAIKIHWWDTDEDIFKTATFQETTLTVTGTAITPNNTSAPSETTDSTSVPINTNLDDLPAQPAPVATILPVWMYALLAASLVLNLILFLLYWKAKQRANEKQEVKDYFSNESAAEEKEAWNQLRHALNGHELNGKNIKKIRHAIISWGKLFWADEQISTLDALARKFNSVELKALFDEIDAAIYGNKPAPTSTDKLFGLLAQLRKTTHEGNKELLGRLYPN